MTDQAGVSVLKLRCPLGSRTRQVPNMGALVAVPGARAARLGCPGDTGSFMEMGAVTYHKARSVHLVFVSRRSWVRSRDFVFVSRRAWVRSRDFVFVSRRAWV